MIEAKERELREEIDELDEVCFLPEQTLEPIQDSYSDEDDMNGSPAFLEPLQDIALKEGDKFSLTCSIAGFPQPKVFLEHKFFA